MDPWARPGLETGVTTGTLPFPLTSSPDTACQKNRGVSPFSEDLADDETTAVDAVAEEIAQT